MKDKILRKYQKVLLMELNNYKSTVLIMDSNKTWVKPHAPKNELKTPNCGGKLC